MASGEIGGRARWARLTAFLAARPPGEESTTLSWVELGRIVGGVPDSAVRHYPQWWHGDRSHVRAWRAAGYIASDIQPGRSVTFRRDGRAGPVVAPAGKQQQIVLLPSSSGAEVSALQGIDPRAALLVIPCSKTKRKGGRAQNRARQRGHRSL